MALHITTNNRERQFNVPFSEENLAWMRTAPILELSAADDELEYIRAQFENIPITKGNYCQWEGEMARFIAKNLK